jgi:hypothetical protein
MSKDNYTRVLKGCIELADNRMESYGDPAESMQDACDILKKIYKIDLTIQQMCYVLICLKDSREMQSHKRDNLEDKINYMAIALNEDIKAEERKDHQNPYANAQDEE